MKKVSLIIPAGGSGKRLGAEKPKQYIEINKAPIFILTIKNFERLENLDSCVIAAHPDWHEYIYDKVESFKVKFPVYCVENGAERQESVYKALKSDYCADSDLVLVHDAVRPFPSMKMIRAVINELENYSAVIPAIDAKDTIKVKNEKNEIVSTLDRAALCMVQTPQGFDKNELIKAYDQAFADGFLGTDDASLIERIGIKVKIVSGDVANFKITDIRDLEEAQRIFSLKR
jgi:2-C-methyl-D-erythritol 4-phosphate cytidylyltransferase